MHAYDYMICIYLLLLHKTDAEPRDLPIIIMNISIIFTNPVYCIKFYVFLNAGNTAHKTLARISITSEKQFMDSRRQFQNTAQYKGKTVQLFDVK